MRQETVEEAAVNCWAAGAWDNRDDFVDGFIEGNIWKTDRSYSETELISLLKDDFTMGKNGISIGVFDKWFNEIKKK